MPDILLKNQSGDLVPYYDVKSLTVKSTTVGQEVTYSIPYLVGKAIVANGTYNAIDDDADGYNSVVVSVPSEQTLENEIDLLFYASTPMFNGVNSTFARPNLTILQYLIDSLSGG